ncbi:AAA family ATPase [Commensalibacter sp. M0357]|uniref:AAA family ATPase n=1 Tax=unclassified Commensalibacter TaxID=2630218 RepID=UPI0018DECC89|nr:MULTISPECIES: ATP-binding protein [unclassified Commensalibacter]MBI0075067.1 AAA family ATPase [Commensalibacter sp. M0357]MBI0084909.1 AAA family ATPase [Commensalibacter sp. M0355]
MKIKNVQIRNFKRFTELKIEGIPETAKMVVLVGPNGCGKSSVFEAFNANLFTSWSISKNNLMYHKANVDYGTFPFPDDSEYYNKDDDLSVDIDYETYNQRLKESSKSLYYRTAYRNQSSINVNSISKKDITTRRPISFISNDEKVALNYTKLIHLTMSGVYAEENDNKTIKKLRGELIGKLQQSVQNVFSDLILNNIKAPLEEGTFYFKKGIIDHYNYKNLSSGEKAAFDLLLDLIINLDDYQDALFLIDEPEVHIHTNLQGKVIEEMYKLIEGEGQLWIATHSLGVMMKAKELSLKNPGSVAFLDFDQHDFDQAVTLRPSPIDRVVWQKFMSVALDGLETKLAPEIIVMCEGSLEGKKRFNFDAKIYTWIFQNQYPHITFISGGACNDLKKKSREFRMLSSVLEQQSKVLRLIDRDDYSDEEVKEFQKEEIFISGRRAIENYLWDDELITKLLEKHNKIELLSEALAGKEKVIKNSVSRKHAEDDLKSASGQIYIGLKKLLNLSRCGNDHITFMRDTMCPLITPDTKLYKEMERDIIEPILECASSKQ